MMVLNFKTFLVNLRRITFAQRSCWLKYSQALWSLQMVNPLPVVSTILAEPNMLVAAPCNDISKAALRQSEHLLRQAIAVSPQSINSTNFMGQTVLDLLVDWLLGLKTLLEAGANPNLTDNMHKYPINYAVMKSNPAAVHLLGEFDSKLYRQLHGGRGYRSPLEEATQGEAYHPNRIRPSNTTLEAKEKTTDTVIALSVTRRCSLQRLVKCSLPLSAGTWMALDDELDPDGPMGRK